MRHKALLLCVVAVALAAGGTRADDERTLTQAHLPTDGAGLLTFFRRGNVTDDQLRELVKKLGDDSFEVRQKASAELTALGPAAAPLLRQALKSGDAEIARRAEECLKNIGGGPSATVVAAAARVLARRKPDGSAAALLDYLPRIVGEPAEDDVRAALAAVAVRDGKPEPVLVTALEDKAPGRRAAAATALTRAGVREALPAVRKLLNDADADVRLQTALALAPLGEKEAIPVLIDLLADLPRTRHAPVEEVLYRLAGDAAPDGLASDDAAERRRYRDQWAGWWEKNGGAADLAKLAEGGKFLGYTMAVMLDAGRIFEVDAAGKKRWQIDGLAFPLDAQRLPGDRVLVTEHKGNRVTERDRKGNVIWEKAVEGPLAAQRLSNGNTFIATRFQVTEVDRDGKPVYSYPRVGDLIMKAQKLKTGEIALVVAPAGGVNALFVRLDAAGKQVASFPVDVRTSGGRIDVLPDGHILAPLKDQDRVVEYDASGRPVWRADFPQPVAAVRLANGHTMVTAFEDKRAVELDGAGKPVWEYKADGRLTRAWRR